VDREERAGGQGEELIHLIKLAVGVRDVAHLDEVQMLRTERDPPLRHQTRNMPKRRDEILDGGSIYWVIGGAVLARQLVLDIVADVWDDGSKCAGFVLDRRLVKVSPRRVKAFQGWRYLAPGDAPADLAASGAVETEMPDAMRQALAALALL
jgi:hypothetical protein